MSARATTRLHYEDPTLLEFDAEVVALSRFGDRPSVILDRSAFYPESGGQLGDVGSLGDVAVIDVQVDDAGVVHHLIDRASIAVGATVRGRVDRARRRLHMALHTGQHMLSRALLDEAGAETVSSRLGSTACTIDVHLASLDEGAVARAEDLVNRVIEDDVAVRQYFPTPEELAKLPLRRAPKVTENVRVVDVGGFDVSPCGGTHCTRSAQVGVVTITGVERYKGKGRVTFLAGRVAQRELSARSKSLAELARSFSCGPLETRAGVERLRGDLQRARESLGLAREQWAALYGQRLVAEAAARGEPRVVCLLEGDTIETLRALASAVSAVPGTVAMLASSTAEGLLITLARGEGSAFDCGAWLKRVAAAHGGRGGGRPDRAEGRLPSSVDWRAAALTD